MVVRQGWSPVHLRAEWRGGGEWGEVAAALVRAFVRAVGSHRMLYAGRRYGQTGIAEGSR